MRKTRSTARFFLRGPSLAVGPHLMSKKAVLLIALPSLVLLGCPSDSEDTPQAACASYLNALLDAQARCGGGARRERYQRPVSCPLRDGLQERSLRPRCHQSDVVALELYREVEDRGVR
jgi:hypothetical protein